MALNTKFYISKSLAAWLERNQSRSVASARENDFGRTYGATIASADPVIPDGDEGAANG